MKEDKQDVKMNFRCTKEKAEELRAEAAMKEVTVSQIILWKLENHKERKKRVDREERVQLYGLRTIVNQIEAGHNVENNMMKLVQEVRDYVSSKGC